MTTAYFSWGFFLFGYNLLTQIFRYNTWFIHLSYSICLRYILSGLHRRGSFWGPKSGSVWRFRIYHLGGYNSIAPSRFGQSSFPATDASSRLVLPLIRALVNVWLIQLRLNPMLSSTPKTQTTASLTKDWTQTCSVKDSTITV